MAPDPRDEIAEAVLYGRMTPNEAEAKLKELGLPPLAPQPNPADFYPMNEVWWSLPMTVAWIAWRTSADVRDAWDTFRREGSFWEHKRWRLGLDGPIHEGWHLQPRAPASLSNLALKEISRRREGALPEGAITVEEAKDRLWKALASGALEAIGKPNAVEPSVPIPELQWRDLAAVEENRRDVVRYRERHGFSRRGYEDVAFRGRDVMAIWQVHRTWERNTALPPLMPPHGPGYMPLFCAVHWIATRGGARSFEPSYATIWEAAYAELLAPISSNQIVVTGVRNGVREKLEGHLFASIPIDYPFGDTSIDLIFKDDLHLQSYVYDGDEQWRKGYDDCLRRGRLVQWSQLMVLKSEIAQWWPFNEADSPQTHSGGAGRPSAMHLVEAEYRRRRERGELTEGIGEVSRILAQWAREAHPGLRTPGAGAIENALRERHRAARTSTK
jgi:hypothetical protein